jgi:hypothetical protein
MNKLDSIVDYLKVFNNIETYKTPEPRSMDQASLADDLEPGALRDEMLKGFDPSQETYEEYLQRINLERPFNMAEGGQLVAPTVDGSRPGYNGDPVTDNIRLTPTGNAYEVAVQRGPQVFNKTFRKENYKNATEALNAAKKFRDQKKKIPFKTGVQEPIYGSTTNEKEYRKKYYEETKELTEAGKLAAERNTKLKNFIGKKKKIKASVLRDYVIDLGYENYDASKIKKKFPNLEIEKDITTGKFKPLNKKEKTLIKDNFDLPEGVKKWDFKKYPYGISSDKHTSLWGQIKRRLKEPGKFTLAANFSDPQGWAMGAMERVLKNELKNKVKYADLTYQPIKNKKGIIVGFIDNTVAGGGNTYYGLKKNAKEYGDGTEWRLHGDFDRIKKFIKIADGVKEKPDKVLQKILDDKGITKLLEGKRNLTLNDILSHERYYSKLSETSPKSLIRRQIVLHHMGGVGDQNLIRAAATKDIQLLTDAVNSKVMKLENIVKGTSTIPGRKLNAAEIKKLKGYEAKIVDFDGRVVGGGYLDPERQYANIEKQALKYARGKDFNLKTVTSYLERLGCGKAAGGRILMRNGGATLTDCAKKGQKVLEEVRTGKITGEAAEQIAKNTAKVVAKAGGKSALASLLGPAGIGLDIVYEVGSVGTDMLMNNVSFKEAMQNNWLTGAFIRGTGEEEYHKGLTKKYSEAKPYARSMDIINRIQDIEGTLATIEADPLTEYGERQDRLQQELESLYKELDVVAKAKGVGPAGQYGKRYTALEHRSPEQIAYDQAKLEYDSGREAKAAIKRPSKHGFEESLKSSRAEPWIDFGLLKSPQYGKYSKRELDKRLKQFGDYAGYGWTPYGLGYGMQQMKPGIGDKKYNKDLGYRELSEMIAKSEATDRIAQAGGVSKMAEGGIMNLKTKW